MSEKHTEDLHHLYTAFKKGERRFPSKQVRDLTQISLGAEFSLVVAVDSDGGLGSLPADVVPCSDFILGRFAIRVPLMEIIASGAVPLAAFDMLTLPMKPHGVEIIRGIRAELSEAGLDSDFPLSGSTEDNIPTTMTGIGTVVIGLVRQDDFRPGTSQAGDTVLCLGKPKSGPQDTITPEDADIVKLSQLKLVITEEGVHDILPVGSRGILYEAGQLAGSAGLNLIVNAQTQMNLNKSAGPGTCALVSCRPESVMQLKNILDVPVNIIGRLGDG